MYVCLCTGVTDHEIRELSQKGARSIEEIGQCSGAGTKCGSCRGAIGTILEGGDVVKPCQLAAGRRGRGRAA